MDKPLTDQVALITGAGQGVGQGIAFGLAKRGVRIIAVGRTLAKCEATVNTVKERFGTEGTAIECDIGVIADLDGLIASAAETFGRLDILVNNAGIHIAKPFTDHGLDEFDHLMKTNVYSVFQLTQQTIRHMQNLGRGKVINVASVAGLRGSMNSAAYNTSKHAIVGLTRCVALENAKNGINVNAICPGIVETDLIKGVEQRMETQGMPPEEFRERILAQIPIGRLLQPEEIANIAVFLASSESDGMSGETISI